MNRIRSSPWFFLLMSLAVAIVTAETAGIIMLQSAAKASRHKLDRAGRELRASAELEPSPTPENAAAIVADLAAGERTLDQWRAALPDESESAETTVAVQRPDAFFELAAFVERMRDQARRAGVRIKADERFGFAAYAHEAPDAAHISAVLRHRRRIEQLVTAVLAAHPEELVGVDGDFSRGAEPFRNGPLGRTSGVAGKSVTVAGAKGSDARLSLRTLGAGATARYRVAFIGSTSVLRTVLDALADEEIPLWVRTVEVRPADVPPEEKKTGSGEPAALVARSRSRFEIAVEAMEPAPAKGARSGS